jgi:hypothetical protein
MAEPSPPTISGLLKQAKGGQSIFQSVGALGLMAASALITIASIWGALDATQRFTGTGGALIFILAASYVVIATRSALKESHRSYEIERSKLREAVAEVLDSLGAKIVADQLQPDDARRFTGDATTHAELLFQLIREDPALVKQLRSDIEADLNPDLRR